jgi:hypothetical protein
MAGIAVYFLFCEIEIHAKKIGVPVGPGKSRLPKGVMVIRWSFR